MSQRYVRVTWMDAAHGGEWYKTDQLPTPGPVISTGWLAIQNDEYVVLAASRYDGDNWGQTIAIPAGMIANIEDMPE